MSNELRRIIPALPPPPAEIFAAAQVTQEFYREVHYREKFKEYCDWYYAVAEQHRREAEKMRHDINILGWFLKGRKSS